MNIKNTLVDWYGFIQKQLDKNESPYHRGDPSVFQGFFDFLDNLDSLESKIITFFAKLNKKEIEKRFLKSLECNIYPPLYKIFRCIKEKKSAYSSKENTT